MSAFDLAGDHDSASLIDQARANPLDLSQPAGFFTGMGTGLVTGLGRLAADTQRTTGLALGAVAGSFDLLTGDAIKAQDKVFEHIVTPADKLSRHLAPKAEEIGMAGQILHGLVKIGGEAVAFGPGGVLVNETVGGTLDALDKGVDLQTAAKVGGVQGAAMTAGVIAPMTLGSTGLGMNLIYGAGINLAQGVFQRGMTSEIYAKAGRADLAMQFKALDGEAMAVDAILGAAFAGGGRALQLRGEKAKADAMAEYRAKIADMLKPSDIDAALVKSEQLKIERPGFGLPADLASRDSHVANMTGAIDDLIEGRPVTMRQEVGDFIPDPAAAKVQEDVAEVLRPAVEPVPPELPQMFPPDQPFYHGTNRVFSEFDPAAPKSTKGFPDRQGFYFSARSDDASGYGQNVMERYLDIKNPKVWEDDLPPAYMTKESIAELKAQGFDSIVWRGGDEVVVFDSGQISEAPFQAQKVGADTTAAPDPAAAPVAGAADQAGGITIPDTVRPDAVIPMDEDGGTATVAEAQGIITDLETAAREQETGLRAAVACFLRAA